MMTSIEVQNLLGVGDYQVVAHGYTVERNTIEIFFANGKLVTQIDRMSTESSVMFAAHYFLSAKRLYENGTHPTLRKLFETFSPYGLPLTPGGCEWGYTVNRVVS